MIEKRKNDYGESVDETIKLLLDLFGKHLLSVSSFQQTTGGPTPMLLVQIDEPFINLLDDTSISSDSKTIPAILKDKIDFPIYIITTREIVSFGKNFPLELVHIKKQYRTHYGKDPIAEMRIDFSNLQNATDTAMQGILMHLRTAYISQNYDDLFVIQLFNKIYAILESALYLRSQSIPSQLCELVFKIENCYNIKNPVLSEIAKKIEANETKGIAENIFDLLLTLEEILAQIKKITESD